METEVREGWLRGMGGLGGRALSDWVPAFSDLHTACKK